MDTLQVAQRDEKKNRSAVWSLIWLCWLAYSASYLGKVNYAANINQIMDFYSVSHAEAGLVSTFLFFSYGAGQFINGAFCKRYNIRWMIAISLIGSGIINLLVALTPSFAIVKWLWLLNGLFLSVLWATVIRLLSETLSKRDMAKASVTMGTTVATGTVIIYALSAVFVSFGVFRLAFWVAAIAMPAVALIWFFAMPHLVKNAREASRQYEEEDIAVIRHPERKTTARVEKKLLYLAIGVFTVIAAAVNLIADGLKTWVPAIFKENYSMDASMSIVLSIALPLVAVFGNLFAVTMHKKIPDFVMQCVFAFALSGGIIGIVIAGLSTGMFILTLVCFALVCFLIGSCNSLITSIFPLFMKDKVNSGMIAGVLNGCCYIGSTISSYGLGLVADAWGWNAVFILLLGVCVLICFIGLVYYCIKRVMQKNAK